MRTTRNVPQSNGLGQTRPASEDAPAPAASTVAASSSTGADAVIAHAEAATALVNAGDVPSAGPTPPVPRAAGVRSFEPNRVATVTRVDGPADARLTSVAFIEFENAGFSGSLLTAGHAGLLLPDVCVADGVTLKMCDASCKGPHGVVLTRYGSISEKENFDFLPIPATRFFYGVDKLEDRPLFITPQMREAYNEDLFRDYVGQRVSRVEGKLPRGKWRNYTASVASRDHYNTFLPVKRAEVEELVKLLNARNDSHFNIFFENCANFAKYSLQFLYGREAFTRLDPAHYPFVNPKALAKQAYDLGQRLLKEDPSAAVRMSRVGQVESDEGRSSDPSYPLQSSLMSNWFWPWYIGNFFLRARSPIAIGLSAFQGLLAPYAQHRAYSKTFDGEVITAIAAYEVASRDLDALRVQRSHWQACGDYANLQRTQPAWETLYRLVEQRKKTVHAIQDQFLGSKVDWARYKEEFDHIVETAKARGLLAVAPKDVYEWLRDHSAPVHENGVLRELDVTADGKTQRVGITRRNALSSDADPALVFKVLLVPVLAQLDAKAKNRGPIAEFRADWELFVKAARKAGIDVQPPSEKRR